jgi:hypothetical protein
MVIFLIMERERVRRMFPRVLLRHYAIMVSDVPGMMRVARAVNRVAVMRGVLSHRSTALVNGRLATGVAS